MIILGIVTASIGGFLILKQTKQSNKEKEQVEDNRMNTGTVNQGDNEKVVIYFSRADEKYGVGRVEVGNTELIAKEIVRKIGATEFRI